jgi:hypothetical protein
MVRFCFMRHNEFAAGLRRAKERGYVVGARQSAIVVIIIECDGLTGCGKTFEINKR